jgi:hypothetical protein
MEQSDFPGKRLENTMVILYDALEICRTWLRDPSDAKYDKTSTFRHRETIILQLFEIDYWLHQSRTQPDTLRMTRDIFHRASTFLKIAQRFNDLPPEPCAPGTSIWNESFDHDRGNQVIQEIRNAFTRGRDMDWNTSVADGGGLYNLAYKVTLGSGQEAISRGLDQFRQKVQGNNENSASSQAESQSSNDNRTNDNAVDSIDDNHAAPELPPTDPDARVTLQEERRAREYAYFHENEATIRAAERNVVGSEERKQISRFSWKLD